MTHGEAGGGGGCEDTGSGVDGDFVPVEESLFEFGETVAVVGDFFTVLRDDGLGVVPAVEDDESTVVGVDGPVAVGVADEVAVSVVGLEFENGHFVVEFPDVALLEPRDLFGHGVLVDGADGDVADLDCLVDGRG